MRIIAGASKGKKILQPKDQLTRPLKDLTKESIFNIIMHSNKFETKIEGSKILDLFSGVGSFGLECLSRGALNAVFIESYKEVLDILKKNIENLNYVNSSTIIEQDIYDSLDFKTLKKFDIIFIDAPYKEKRVDMLLQKIFDAKILNDKSIIIIHRHKKENENFIDNFNIIEEKIYGISKVIFGNFL
ncbi:16S rRNA (guanine(966)-N(2))-methyltransferase RsmD [Candidatus Pelagibacter sp.]|jgi:16S rRNA (guanine966-N2)-methyltransferase|nr:16S rRNA (guanine(966)-N(2))-methyltransferase RsmD [Candidatus Pelagibacter bacterium]MDC0427384.1 16S rRNA (guanine(966)-N(2))-methyltransferase RsmD [Candidatus Pelagibacter sp.]MDC0448251.1 16S rRNA (guanine(966)-N(2))-methyltransferase RsmD [Candidatus Pelagibacter sp.]|tara:strand:+ start:2387 stop:2947 length:561 start_codon:yes stop_codon:yes gene_type:complete